MFRKFWFWLNAFNPFVDSYYITEEFDMRICDGKTKIFTLYKNGNNMRIFPSLEMAKETLVDLKSRPTKPKILYRG